jgi:GNAT superfamily N-acetyltransferase
MIQINKEEIIKLLSKNMVNNCGEIIEIEVGGIEFYIKNENSDDRLIAYKFRDDATFEIVTNDDDFCRDCFRKIEENPLSKIFLKLSPQKRNLLNEIKEKYTVEFINKSKNLCLKEPYNKSLSNVNIKKLSVEDEELSNKFHSSPKRGRPDFQTLFKLFVKDTSMCKGSTIYAVIENEKIVAYLSCFIFKDNIYNVDYVFVIPEKRGFGIGAELIKYYVEDIISIGGIPRYGNAENEFSWNAAEKAGFIVIREIDKYLVQAI